MFIRIKYGYTESWVSNSDNTKKVLGNLSYSGYVPDEGEGVPSYATAGAAGIDLHADVAGALVIQPGSTALVKTGLRVAIPTGLEAQVRPRSGLALKHGITVLNSPGTIDEDYRGEIGVILINHGREAFTVNPGARIAQLVFAPVIRVTFEWETLESFEELVTVRGHDGFGSTGVEKN